MNHRQIIEKLDRHNFEAFTVGGCVRDACLGLKAADFDVVTNAHPEEIIELFSDRNVKEVGKSFGVILVDDIEVATYRVDHHSDEETTVTFAKTLVEDLSRRDLTINAMAFDEFKGVLVDEHGGRSDCHNRVIRFVGNPIERIKEDPCRILRACRFLARIDGTFDKKTFNGLRWGVETDRIKEIAPERIRLEIMKAMKIKNASAFFGALHMIGALKLIFPALDSCFGHEHGNHHVENVWEHCMIAGDSISTQFPLLKLAGYLHDCGKPQTFNPETKQFIGHEMAGARIAQTDLNILKFTTQEVLFVRGLIRSHMNSVQKMTPRAVRRFLKRLADRNVDLNDFFRIRMADRKANIRCEPFRLREWVEMIKQINNPAVKETPVNVLKLVVKGGDLINEFNLRPGPIVGIVHRHLLDFVINKGAEFNKREVLLAEAKRFIFRD